MPRKSHTGISVETPPTTQLPKNEETGNITTSFPESPINGTGMYTCQREKDEEIQEAGLTDPENQMEQTEFAAGHLIDVKIAIDSFVLKEKHHNENVESFNECEKVQNVLYH